MTRDEAEGLLADAGRDRGDDAAFPLFEAALACAVHDDPMRDAEAARALAATGAAILAARLADQPAAAALVETLTGDLRLSGDVLNRADLACTDLLSVALRRRGVASALSVFYVEIARRAGLRAWAVDFPQQMLVRLEAEGGTVILDPFAEGRRVSSTAVMERALRAGLAPHEAARPDRLTAPAADRALVLRLQAVRLKRATRVEDWALAERVALRCALLDPDDPSRWLAVASAREAQGALAGALAALEQARGAGDAAAAPPRPDAERVRLRLN